MRSQLLRITEAGRRNLLFHVPIEELYDLWAKCRKESDYFLGLLAMNHFYNFGRQITPIGSTKLLSLCIRCKQYEEAIKEPPSLNLIYTLMSIFFVRGEYDRVRLCFKHVRENWKLKLRPRLYEIGIRSCLLYPKNALEESLILYNDSELMGVLLPERLHALLLEFALDMYDRGGSDSSTAQTALDRLEREVLVSGAIALSAESAVLVERARAVKSPEGNTG